MFFPFPCREALRILLSGSDINVDKLQPPAAEIAHSYDQKKELFTATLPNGTEVSINYNRKPSVTGILNSLR